MTMKDFEFKSLMRRVKLLEGDYGRGYESGLRAHYHGQKGTGGNSLTETVRAARQDEWGRGYRDGLAGQDPAPLMGRPPLPADAPRSEKRVRSVRLSDEHWEKLKRLGTDWLERSIERAREPDDSTR